MFDPLSLADVDAAITAGANDSLEWQISDFAILAMPAAFARLGLEMQHTASLTMVEYARQGRRWPTTLDVMADMGMDLVRRVQRVVEHYRVEEPF